MASATINISCTIQDGKSVDLGAYFGSPKIESSTTLSSSDSSKAWTDGRSISSADVLDVSDGSLVSAYGVALTFASVKAVVVQNTHASATLVIGGGTNPLFGATESITVKAGQTVSIGAVPATVDATHEQITITPSAAATFNIAILGS